MSAVSPAVGSSYDAVPYESLPFAQTHPDRLATLAHLFGLTPPPLAHCRVLELGCAGGGNLIPMALAMPGAQFVGVDLSSVQVAQGQALIDALGLRNIRLLACSITDIDATLGRFDYIVTHGVYSWVPEPVQEKILAICAEQLSDHGVAYVSYNTLPGWHMRGMVRDLMRYHAMPFADPGQRVAQARGIVDFLAQWVPAQDNAYGLLLQRELQTLRSAPDYYVLHEHLEDINEPLYFHQFAQRAAQHGLQYLAEADVSSMLASNLPPEVSTTLAKISNDVIRQEQFMDFLRNRSFRQTLLVRQGQPVNRTLTPGRVQALWIGASLQADSPAPDLADLSTRREEVFRGAHGGLLKTPNPVTKAAMRVLAQHGPGTLAFDDLLAQALRLLHAAPPAAAATTITAPALDAQAVLASDLLQCHLAGLVELHAAPAPYASPTDLRPHFLPCASPLVRWQAARGLSHVTTLRHEPLQIDAGMARMLVLLDGSRNADAIGSALEGTELARLPVPALLDQVARAAVLMAVRE